jgi:predicted nucleic acid-binding protein
MDSTFLIDVMDEDRRALAKAEELHEGRHPLFIGTPVLYEVTTGILFRGSRQEAQAFSRLASRFTILPFDEPSAKRAAEIQADLLRVGKPKGQTDVMIAGIAAAGGHSLVTRDRDFEDIAAVVGLALESY